MRRPLATRKKVPVSYKTLIQYTPAYGLVTGLDVLSNFYLNVREAIKATRRRLLAADVKHIQEEIQAQDNSDLDIREAPSHIATVVSENIERAFTDTARGRIDDAVTTFAPYEHEEALQGYTDPNAR